MNMQPIAVSIILLLSLRSTDAEALPPEFSIFEKYVGEWLGNVKLEFHTANGIEKIEYQKTSACEFDTKRGAFVMVDSEVDPVTKVKGSATTEIRWDKVSESYKAIHWGSDGSANLYVIESRQDTLHYRMVDSPPGHKLEFVTSVVPGAKVNEKGSTTLPDGTTIIWTVIYARVNAQRAEQAGAGQPATRPESKSEGGDKPQPEAEGRSR